MTPDPQVEPQDEDEMELDEDNDKDEQLLLATRNDDDKISVFVLPDVLEPAGWGLVLADVMRLIAWSLAKSSGDESRRRQAEMLVQVKRYLLDELENPTSDLEVWTERSPEES